MNNNITNRQFEEIIATGLVVGFFVGLFINNIRWALLIGFALSFVLGAKK